MSEEGYELQYIQEAFSTNWVAPLGPNVDNFERELASKVGIDNAVALVSGTSAIHMALKAAGIEEGDIVICQSLTFSATANPIIYERAIPVFVDSDVDNWNMSPFFLEQALIKYPQTKAVIVVHLYGMPAKMDEIIEICKKYKVTLIEDAAESLGATYKGKYTGTFGNYGIYSFNGNKIITTSGGGMLISNEKERIDKVRFWSTQARDKARHYQHSELGYNYRMSNVLAGVGRGQLKILDKRILKKKAIFDFYQNSFKKCPNIHMMPINDSGNSNYWLSCILLNDCSMPIRLIEALEKENIEARPIWKPMHLQPFFCNYDYIGGNVAEQVFTKGLCLPSDTKLSEDQLKRIVSCIIREMTDHENL